MDKYFLSGKKEYRNLNGHTVMVIAPRRRISYEEAVKRTDRIIAKIKKEAAKKEVAIRTVS